jgi:hypothetical protein
VTWQISPFGNDQFFSSNGTLAVGYKLYTYLAGTTTKEAVAADFAGSANHTNPIVLNSIGLPPGSPIFLDIAKSYKFVYATPADTDPPASPLYTADNITVKDLTNTLNEWLAGTTPTYISANSFSVTSDQRLTYHVGRRVKLVASGSTVYGVISASVFVTVTTITVLVDDGLTISASLNSVFYSFLSAAGSSWPVGFNTALKTTLNVSDARTTTVNNPLELNAQTTGTPAAGIGTGILLRAESGDEAPSDFGQLDASASNVTAGLEQTFFRVWLRIAGAVLTEVWRWAATSLFKGIFTHANTADRTYTWPNRDTTVDAGDIYMGPSAIGSGSTVVHEGTITISGNQALQGVHFYTDFTLNSGTTLTLNNDAHRLVIVATGTITINGTIDGIGAGSTGGVGSINFGTVGSPGVTQAGGGGGGGSTQVGLSGGAVLVHGLSLVPGGTAGAVSGNGGAATALSGANFIYGSLFDVLGGAGGGGGSGDDIDDSGGAGGRGGGSIILIAPTIVLGSASVFNTSGDNGTAGAGPDDAGGGGGGGSGTIYMRCRIYTNNGATFTQTGGSGGAAGGAGGVGGAGAAGFKQINIYA